jgi:hypothetical protein
MWVLRICANPLPLTRLAVVHGHRRVDRFGDLSPRFVAFAAFPQQIAGGSHKVQRPAVV